MSGVVRRFPRTARAIPEARPKIEREKIKHRRPNDHLFDDQEAPVTPHSFASDDVDHLSYADDSDYDNAESDWTDLEEGDHGASVWDEESEDDWVLDGDDDPDPQALQEDAYDDGAEDSGVVWEDDDFSAQPPADDPATDYPSADDPHADDPDELAFGPQGDSYGSAVPEMELAGRRDVRPKAPRPAPQAQAPRTPQRMQRLRGQRSNPRSRQPRPGFARAEPDFDQPAASEPSYWQNPRAARSVDAAHPASPPAENSRFSRTRATLAPTGGSDEAVLQPSRRAPPQRRRKAPAAAPPRLDQRFAARYGRGRGRGLIAIVLLALLAAGGWFAYQSIGPDGVRPMIDRLTALLPLPGSSRTAADTSFGGQEPAENAAAEQALSDLEARVRQQNGGELAPAQTAPPVDPATTRTDGPPIPKFKPIPGATRSLSGQVPARNSGQADNDETSELSIFEQLWRYVSPG